MTEESSDPYIIYLDLPAGPRPPHFYDLLGLELFCSHHERINQAVRKQFRVIKRFHDHHDRETRETIQDIMSAIAEAKSVLTDPVRKEDYDKALARQWHIDRDALLASQVATALPDFEVVVIAGPTLVGHRIELIEGSKLTVGAHAQCLLTLDSSRAAERHCNIEHVDGAWIVTPADEECPVLINGNPCDGSALVPGDKIDVAGYRLLFQCIDRAGPVAGKPPQGAAPPLTLIVQKGPSIPNAIFKAVPPQRIVIGQSEAALWQLPDHTVSRVHCAIATVGDRWEIEDLDSRNGTKVNGVDVLRGMLNDRDVVNLGALDVLVSLRF